MRKCQIWVLQWRLIQLKQRSSQIYWGLGGLEDRLQPDVELDAQRVGVVQIGVQSGGVKALNGVGKSMTS